MMINVRIMQWLVVVSVLLVTACSDAPKLAPLPSNATVLAFGDSLTRGTGASSEHSYPAQLARLTGLSVVNEGVPGELSKQGAARLASVLDRVQPDLLLLCHGGNDILRNLDKSAMQSNLQSMIDMAYERGIPVVLIAVPQRSLLLRAETRYQDLARQNQLVFAPNVVADVLGERALRSDQIHPNAAGYKIIAETIAQLLRESGAI
ncbi:arylesterase [Gilvimarinus sp. SDUM040013]|uniref:Arylesterase n=1 Tax=Gilvimarinus gilvus TaxID=3058038 RepID=A0ABU4S2U1_9GAMM|nr:arylesterase [Gilvimarinus sp. SDUM040013]MDO3384704.1 arylesterase [Gilvimarinus sp. SDUM040013]MDX6850821.1 arylesterase [Gilvimarinus sp. SDUM040013]